MPKPQIIKLTVTLVVPESASVDDVMHDFITRDSNNADTLSHWTEVTAKGKWGKGEITSMITQDIDDDLIQESPAPWDGTI